MTRDVGCAAPGRLWQTRRGQREKKSSKERAERETRERTTLITKKTQKSKKWQKRKKREKDGERADGEKISSSVFFFVRKSCSFSRLSSLRSLTRSSKKNRHFRRTVGKKRSTKHSQSRTFLSSAGEEAHDSPNAQNRFRMAPRCLDRRSERIFHFQRTVERILRGERKEEYS